MKRFVGCLVIFFLFSGVVAARSGEIPLLAVSDTGSELSGSIATLALEIQPGKGRVFIDTFPFAQLDTQISTRFAKEIACNFIDAHCYEWDFFYTITADAPIIGGPSAGAAVAVLTIVLLEDLPYDESMAITGTINSGGVIGPVSGLREKIEAAGENSVNRVLIPLGTKEYTVGEIDIGNDTANQTTISLLEYGQDLGITVAEVSDLNQVILEFTGKQYFDTTESVRVDAQYSQTMKTLSDNLCLRGETLRFEGYKNDSLAYEEFVRAEDLVESANNATLKEQYYSAASYCFGANIQYQYAQWLHENISTAATHRLFEQLEQELNLLQKEMQSRELATILDLQAYAVTSERLNDAYSLLNDSRKQYQDNSTQYLYTLAFGRERLQSAIAWSDFFDGEGTLFVLDEAHLRRSCLNKLAEARSRVHYAQLIIDRPLELAQEDIRRIEGLQRSGDYVDCLYQSAQLKAEANVILTTVGVGESTVDAVISTKMDIVRRLINRQIARGVFPIVGYSYLEYAEDLGESDKGSALLYLEYALELSDIALYFPAGDTRSTSYELNLPVDVDFVLGILFGAIIGFFFAIGLRKMLRKRKY